MECSGEPASAPRGRKIEIHLVLDRMPHGVQAACAKYLEASLKLHAQTNVLDNLAPAAMFEHKLRPALRPQAIDLAHLVSIVDRPIVDRLFEFKWFPLEIEHANEHGQPS